MEIIPTLGAHYLGEGATSFLVWAPNASSLEVRITGPAGRLIRTEPRENGYFAAVVDGIVPDARYFYRLNGKIERPDPASLCVQRPVPEPFVLRRFGVVGSGVASVLRVREVADPKCRCAGAGRPRWILETPRSALPGPFRVPPGVLRGRRRPGGGR